MLMTLVLLLGGVYDGYGCTLIAVGKKATEDGSVILSHTDCGPDSRIFAVPGRKYKTGEKAPVYWGIQDAKLPLKNDGEIIGHIPQVTETYGYFHSAYSHINEHQLAIAESTMAQKDELMDLREDGNVPKQIMTIEQAQIFALQRCKKAREAVKLIGDLMTTYGFLPSSGDGSEGLVIGDTEEAWVFEVFGVGKGWTPESKKPGAIWAAQRLADDAACIIPNWSIIKEIDVKDKDRFMVSSNYMQEAVTRGWYDPKGTKPFVWQDAYAPIPAEYATSRFWLFLDTYAPNLRQLPDRKLKGDSYLGMNQYFQYVEPLTLYPFSIKPEKKISVRNIIAFQRSYLQGTIYDLSGGPQWLVPDEKGKFVKSPLATPFPGNDLRKLLRLTNRRPVARHRGHYGMVAQLRSWLPNAIGGVYWVYLDNPMVSPYIPIYAGNISVDASYNIYNPEKYEETSARWAIDFVENLARLCFQKVIKDIQAERDPFEDDIFAQQKKIEEKALKLFKKKPKTAKKYLTDYSNGLMKKMMVMYTGLRNTLITNYTNNRE
ncbi:MAG: peptidase [bacterium]|nr:peptidase [bacterium]